MRTSDDQTLFAWQRPRLPAWHTKTALKQGCRLLALGPEYFYDSADYIPDELRTYQEFFFLTNKGLNISVSVELTPGLSSAFAVLACRSKDHPFQLIGIKILLINTDIGYRRDAPVSFIGRDEANALPRKPLRLLHERPQYNNGRIPCIYVQSEVPILIRKLPEIVKYDTDMKVKPAESWLSTERLIFRPAINENYKYHAIWIYIKVSHEVSWVVKVSPRPYYLRRQCWGGVRVVSCDAKPRTLSRYRSDTSEDSGTREGEIKIKPTFADIPLLMDDGKYVYTLDIDFEK